MDNVLHRGCLHELITDKSEHRESVIVKDNPGSVFKPALTESFNVRVAHNFDGEVLP